MGNLGKTASDQRLRHGHAPEPPPHWAVTELGSEQGWGGPTSDTVEDAASS